MIGGWLRGLRRREPAEVLYGSIVAAARQPQIYAVWGVPDTPDGRFEMLAAHVALVVYALAGHGERGSERGRALAEAFVADVDDNLREIGVGDLAVPRKVKKAAAAVFDRFNALRGGADSATPLAVNFLIGNDFQGSDLIDRVRIEAYFDSLVGALQGLPREVVLAEQFEIPMLANDLQYPDRA